LGSRDSRIFFSDAYIVPDVDDNSSHIRATDTPQMETPPKNSNFLFFSRMKAQGIYIEVVIYSCLKVWGSWAVTRLRGPLSAVDP